MIENIISKVADIVVQSSVEWIWLSVIALTEILGGHFIRLGALGKSLIVEEINHKQITLGRFVVVNLGRKDNRPHSRPPLRRI